MAVMRKMRVGCSRAADAFDVVWIAFPGNAADCWRAEGEDEIVYGIRHYGGGRVKVCYGEIWKEGCVQEWRGSRHIEQADEFCNVWDAP